MSPHTRFVIFSLLLLFSISSLICAIYFIYNLIKIPSFRKRFQNQTLIILVFIVTLNILFNIPTTLTFLARGNVLIESASFCHFWQCMDYILTACIIWCKAIFTIERYILVFKPHHLRTKRQRLIFHFIPLIFINLYLILFYIFTSVFYHCESVEIFHEMLCGTQCLDGDGSLPTFNWIFNILCPAFVIIFGSLVLLIHVLWKRREMQRNLRSWSKNWKMIIQLLGIAIVYTIVWLPLAIITLAKSSNGSESHDDSVDDYFYYLTYIVEFSVPLIAVLLSPEMISRFHRQLPSSTRRIGSITTALPSTN